MQNVSNSRKVKIGEASRLLGVSPDTLRRWDKSGKLKSGRLGKDRYYKLSQLLKFKKLQPLTISQAAKKIGVSKSTLRRYEKKGLLVPARDNNKRRLYGRDVVRQKIKTPLNVNQSKALFSPLQLFGISLAATVFLFVSVVS